MGLENYNAGQSPSRTVLVDPATGNDIPAGGGTGSSANQIQGNVAHDAVDSGNPVKIGARASNVGPTAVAAGDRTDVLANVSGMLAISAYDGGQDAGGDSRPTLVGFSSRLGFGTTPAPTAVGGFKLNGTSWDRDRKPNLYARVASSAASGSPAFLKATAGDVSMFWGQNGAAITYLQIYNKASAPVIGTDVPVLTYPVAANAFFSETIPNGGAYLSAGIAYAFTTDAAGTTGAAAAAVLAFGLLGA